MAAHREREYTSWGIIGAGEGGGRIASQFLTRTENPGIDDRIVIINTHHGDIQQTLDRIESNLAIDRESINREHVAYFGSEAGVGNDYLRGEQMAADDFDQIFQPIENTLAGTDAFMYTLGLGGGTGNGSVPYLINQLNRGPDRGETAERGGNIGWLGGLNQIALAAWPYRDDPVQQHFNAVAGLSRLLMREDGERNADMTILVSNTHLENEVDVDSGTGGGGSGLGNGGQLIDRNEKVNSQIIPAVDLLISAGRHSVNTVDVNDYIRKPHTRGVFHATFGVALDKPIGLDLEKTIEKAANNTYVPMDPSTCGSAYVVVRAPERRISDGDVTMARVSKAFNDWKADIGIRRAVGMPTLSRKSGPGNSIDVLLLLGGFDLEPLFDGSWDLYEDEKEALRRTKNGRKQLQHVENQEQNLLEYIDNLNH
jgi:hypothetical protein